MTKCNGTKFLPHNSISLTFWTIFFTENIGYPFNIFPVIGTWGTKYLKETKVKFKNFSSIVNAYWRQVQKNDERTERQTVAEWRHLNLICNTLKQSHGQNFSLTSERDILSSQRSITPSKIDAKWQHSNLLCSTLKQSHVQNFSSICQSMQEKTTENCVFPIF